MTSKRSKTRDYLENLPQRILTRTTGMLPHLLRLRLAGWCLRRVVANVPGLRKRAAANLVHVFPEKTAAERLKIQHEMATNVGRTMLELFHMPDFLARAKSYPVSGPGLDALIAAQAAGKGAIVASGHFGQWEAVRAILTDRGINCAAIYRAYNNRFYEADVRPKIEMAGTPLFSTRRRGILTMVRHLAGGGFVAILTDQRRGSVEFDFLGKPTFTSTAAADMALKFKLPLVPAYGIRAADGISVDVVFEAPIPHTTPVEMTQALNDSLSARVRNHPGQYFWLHWRWGKLV